MSRAMDNTTIFCLHAIKAGHRQARSIALQRWPQSKQIEKKIKTIELRLKALSIAGYVRKCGIGVYVLTDAGIKAQETLMTTKKRPPMHAVIKGGQR